MALRRAKQVDRMTKEEAKEILSILAAEFGCKVPALYWSDNCRRGSADRTKWRISAGPRVWRGSTNCLIHEFAHILTYHRFKEDHGSHGNKFINALYDVAVAWLGDSSKYDWSSEYYSVMAAGPKQSQRRW